MIKSKIFIIFLFLFLFPFVNSAIIADHTAVEEFDQIPDYWINEVKKTMLIMSGESHSTSMPNGLNWLESNDSRFQVTTTGSYPGASTDQYFRFGRGLYTSSGWIGAGEEDTWAHPLASTRVQNTIDYLNSQSSPVNALGFAWCWDMCQDGTCYNGSQPWSGKAYTSFEGYLNPSAKTINWDLDTTTPNLQDYLDTWESLQQANPTVKMIYATGPVDSDCSGASVSYGCQGYQRWIKHERIRQWVNQGQDRVLFDFADILTHTNAGAECTTTWTDNYGLWGATGTQYTIPTICQENLSPEIVGTHMSENASIRLAKAAWWMMARLAGWNGTGSDTTPPVRSNGSPSGTLAAGTTTVNLSLTTNENAICRYSTTANVSYASMTGTFTTTGNTTHLRSLTGLTNGSSYNYYVKCMDTTGNANTTDYTISFSVATSSGDTIPPVRSNGQPSGTLVAGTTTANLSLITNENATCKYATTTGLTYASMQNNFTSTGSTSHSRSLTGLTNGSSYNYYVKCLDSAGNANTTDYTISFSISSGSQNVNVALVFPSINSNDKDGSVYFQCGGKVESGSVQLSRVQLYTNIYGSWQSYGSPQTLSGTENVASWTINNIPNGQYEWNCIVTDTSSNTYWGSQNRLFQVNITALQPESICPGGSNPDPNVLFCDDFEDGTWRNTFIVSSAFYPEYHEAVRCDNDEYGFIDGCAASSGHQMHFDNQHGYDNHVGSRYFDLDELSNGQQYDELYVRLYLYISDPYEWGDTSDKGIYFRTPTTDEGGDGANFLMEYNRGFENTGKPTVSSYVLSPNQKVQNMGNDIILEPGKWYLVEFQGKLSDPGVPNGIGRLWIDEVDETNYNPEMTQTLRLEYTNLLNRTASQTNGFVRLWLTDYHQTCWPANEDCPESKNQYVKWDNIVVSNSPIGPAYFSGTPSDTTPPVRSNGSPSGTLAAGTTTATLSLITNENATCKYSTTANVSYASMTGTFTTTGNTNHSRSLTGLTNGSSYNYYVKCRDTTGNANTTDYPISFSVASLSSNVLFEDDFESGDFSAWTEVDAPTSIVSSNCHQGNYCALRTFPDPHRNLEVRLDETFDEAYLSYWVKFSPEFAFGIPWSGGLHFVRFWKWVPPYYYSSDHMDTEWGYDSGSFGFVFFRNDADDVTSYYVDQPFSNNVWQHIEVYFKLNDAGQSNGVFRWWLDGQLMVEDTSAVLRSGSTANLVYDVLAFTNYDHGNDPSEYYYLDDVLLLSEMPGQPSTCTNGQTRNCTTTQNCPGTQTCSNNTWGSCVDTQNDGCPSTCTLGITVDSTYSGYSSSRIDDGVINAYGGTTTTWASNESSTQAHWIEINYCAPTTKNKLEIWWAFNDFQQNFMASQQIQLQYWNGSSFVTAGTMTNTTAQEKSTLNFTPVTATRFRLYQPVNMGYSGYARVIWLTEIELSQATVTECTAGQTQLCVSNVEENCSGTKACVNGFWGTCVDTPNDNCPVTLTCSDGEEINESCYCGENIYSDGFCCSGSWQNSECVIECEEDWFCENWSSCLNGTQFRDCTDLSECGNPDYNETQSCGECTNVTTQGCTVSNCPGTQTCSSNVWGSCVDTANDGCPSNVTPGSGSSTLDEMLISVNPLIIKPGISFTITVSEAGSTLMNAKVKYAGKSYFTNSKGQVSLKAIKDYNSFSVSKSGYKTQVISLNIILFECGNRICETGENETTCSQDCLIQLGELFISTSVEGETLTVAVVGVNGKPVGDVQVVYGEETKRTNSLGITAFTELTQPTEITASKLGYQTKSISYNPSLVCEEGTKVDCTTTEDCLGEQICVNGKWSFCKDVSNDSCPTGQSANTITLFLGFFLVIGIILLIITKSSLIK